MGGGGGEIEGDEKVCIDVPHHQQRYRWDCGLACAQMVLGFYKTDPVDFDQLCKDLKFGESVWTIDLACIMIHYAIKNHFCTITVGVDRGYSDKSFYKDKFATDEERVNHLFENANDRGINVQNRPVSLSEILQHLSERKILIALVDWSHISCKWCGIAKTQDQKDNFTDIAVFEECVTIPCVGKCLNVFQGHFITVCGYDKKDKIIYFKNPSSRQKLCCCSMKSFETARKSYGTDEDLLFLDSVPDEETTATSSAS